MGQRVVGHLTIAITLALEMARYPRDDYGIQNKLPLELKLKPSDNWATSLLGDWRG